MRSLAVVHLSCALALVTLSAACGLDKLLAKATEEGEASPTPTVAEVPGAVVDGETPPVAAEDTGPLATIPAGTLLAGTACGGVPRITNEEPVHASYAMADFTMDVYPYPNDPSQPPRTGVTRDEAAGLCAARGKRLCTELEWERACKGPNNATFEYGASYDAQACRPGANLLPGQRAKCTSGFGVKDMHGLVWEWTASPWGRGQGLDLVTTRGSAGTASVLHERCANGRGRSPTQSAADVGFRCCGGPENPARVDISISRLPPMVQDPAVDATLAAQMLRAMPPDHQSVPDTDVSFDRVWRWHPRDNEELLIGRWAGRPKKGKRFYELAVFKVCRGVPARIARMRGPVEKLGNPSTSANAERASASVETGSDRGSLQLTYWYGSVKLEEPAWIKTGNRLEEEEEAAEPSRVRIRPDRVRPETERTRRTPRR